MGIKAKSQIALFIALILSLFFYFLNIYPRIVVNLGENASLGFVLFIYIGFLASYFSFFIWPNMGSFFYIGLSILLIIFFNLFFVITSFSSYAPLGVIAMLIFLIGILITNKKRKNVTSA